MPIKAVQECGCGRGPADDFRPKDHKRVREAMVARRRSRSYVNSQINRVRRMFLFFISFPKHRGGLIKYTYSRVYYPPYFSPTSPLIRMRRGRIRSSEASD